jgi:hypothetical protein
LRPIRVGSGTFADDELPTTLVGQVSEVGYLWSGDLSSFSGQTGELRFSGRGLLDDIKFSSEPIFIASPQLSQPRLRKDGNFEFNLEKPYGTSYTVQVSTNLTTWLTLSNVPANFFPPVSIIDATASNAPMRFYRTVWP